MCCVLAVLGSVLPGSLGSSFGDRQYLNEWAVEIPGGLAAAQAVAKELEYELVQQVSGHPDQHTMITIIIYYMCYNENSPGGALAAWAGLNTMKPAVAFPDSLNCISSTFRTPVTHCLHSPDNCPLISWAGGSLFSSSISG